MSESSLAATQNEVVLPSSGMVALCGPVGAGKTTLARSVWPEDAHIDVSAIRLGIGGLDDPETLRPAFVKAYARLEERLRAGQLVVFDSTAVTQKVRLTLIQRTRRYGMLPHLVIVDTPSEIAAARNAGRDDPVPDTVVAANHEAFRQALPLIRGEAWASVTVVTPEMADELLGKVAA